LDCVNDDDAGRTRSPAPGQRSGRVLLLAAIVGALTGLGVAGFEEVVVRGLDALADLPLWAIALAPTLGPHRGDARTLVDRSGRVSCDRRRVPARVP
jgi:hypothetical protein